MSGFKGTPGKWAVGMDGEILSDAGYIVMATDLVHGNEHDRELIATAPELLELVMQANGINGCHTVSWQEKARSAIAKVLGQ